MAKNKNKQRSNKNFQSGGIATAPSKLGSFKIVVEQKGPADGSKVNQSGTAETLTHQRIAERAWSIWQNRGCSPGEDERNWLEAETQLKQELAVN